MKPAPMRAVRKRAMEEMFPVFDVVRMYASFRTAATSLRRAQ